MKRNLRLVIYEKDGCIKDIHEYDRTYLTARMVKIVNKAIIDGCKVEIVLVESRNFKPYE